MNLIEWINGTTKLNKTTMDQFQDNIKDAIDDVADDLGTAQQDIEDLNENKQNNLIAGDNISIENDTISVEGISDDYSTTEAVVGTWTDGKPLYKKTVNIGSLPNNQSNVQTAHGISNLNKVIKVETCWYDTTDNAWFNTSRYGEVNGQKYDILFKVSSSYILTTATIVDWSSRTNNCNVTVYYTKTTD